MIKRILGGLVFLAIVIVSVIVYIGTRPDESEMVDEQNSGTLVTEESDSNTATSTDEIVMEDTNATTTDMVTSTTSTLLSGVSTTTSTTSTAKDIKKISATTTNYSVDASQSRLGWGARRIVGASHAGIVGIKNGSAVFDGTMWIKGETIIDMTTIKESTNNETFLKHISSDAFFDVAKYGTAKFVLQSAKETSAGPVSSQYLISGNLTIRDITHIVSFPATVVKQGELMTVNAQFSIDRTKWGIVYDSGTIVSTLGDKAIKDDISFTLSLVLKTAK